MHSTRLIGSALAGALILFGGVGASAQRSDAPKAFAAIARGQWQLKEASGGLRKICLTTPTTLVQIRHAGIQCEQFVMEDAAGSATVRYTCAGHGHGRTTVTVETASLVRIETQGVADGSPFSEDYEGRLLGKCG